MSHHNNSHKNEKYKNVKANNDTPKDAPHVDVTSEPETVPFASGESKEAPAKENKTPIIDTVEQLKEQLEQAKDRTLRCQAELDNYRKRAAREMEDQNRYANISFMRELLPVLDNIYRAIEAAEKSTDGSGLLDGVKLVAQQLEAVLERHHCVKIPALHQPFDPNLHHAILQQPSDEYPENTVLLVTQEGYQLHDRVVRPSQVIVSISPSK